MAIAMVAVVAPTMTFKLELGEGAVLCSPQEALRQLGYDQGP